MKTSFVGKKVHIKKKLMPLIIVVSVIAVFGILYLFYINGPQVSTTGISTMKVQPDTVSIYVTVESRHLSSQVAQSAVKLVFDGLLSELKEFGLEEKDLQLGNYNVYPEYDWVSGSQKIKGYVASQQLIVKVNSFEKVTYIIDVIAKTDALISGINYELSTPKQNEYKAQALNEASKDAEIKAESVASGFGKRLGKLVAVQSQEFNYYPYPLYTREDAFVGNSEAVKSVSSLGSGISPRELEISANVYATYSMTRF